MKEENDNIDLSAKLKEEAETYYKLAKDFRRSNTLRENVENFLLNKHWLEKWKKYVDYKTIKESSQNYYYYSNYNKKPHTIDLENNPGEIDNNCLLVPLDEFLNDGDATNTDNQVIKHTVDLRNDIKIVNKKIWEFFVNIYGGGPEIQKPFIEDTSKSYSNSKIVEIILRKLNILTICDRKNMTEEILRNLKPEILYISRVETLENLKDKIVDLKKLKNFYSKNCTIQNIRLYKLKDITWENAILPLIENCKVIRESDQLIKYDKLIYLEDIPNQKIDDTDLADTDICIVEYAEEDNKFLFDAIKTNIKKDKCEYCNQIKYLRQVCSCKEVAYCTTRCMQNDKNYHKNRCRKSDEEEENSLKETPSSKKGLTGLQNLGNTCFMNTSLQCMSNCYELTEYFLKDLHKKDINKDNPIGTGGDLALAYGIFLKNVWYGDSSVFSPWTFKRAISGFQSMFSGYQQHDTQEFLNFLLDGLHEDLNRVLKKPLVDRDDSKKPDDVKSLESWVGFLRRNQSLLVDLFYGQFKSTLYCPDSECQNISTCFDPYLSISLPLVSRTETYELTCFFIFYDISIKPLQLDVQFSSETTIMALRNKVSKILDIHPFSFLIAKFENLSTFECLYSSPALLKPNNYSTTRKQFFLFQIDPDFFYTKNNKFVLAQPNFIEKNKNFKLIKQDIEKNKNILNELFDLDYEEDESGATSEQECYYSRKIGKEDFLYKVNTDENNGFDSDWLKVPLYLRKYDSTHTTSRRDTISFPRVIYLNKNWNLKFVHRYIFNYISNLIKISDEKYSALSKDELYTKFYSCLENSNIEDSIDSQNKNNIPYRLRISSAGKREFLRSNSDTECFFCQSSRCDGCLVPIDENVTLREYISKIPKNTFEKDIDNSYLFLHERYKSFISVGNRDLTLELTWLPEYSDSVKKLLEKEVIDFKVQKHEREDGINIVECFKNFIKLEKLEANNEWFCPDCKNHVKATKKMEIFNSPNILIIHLKRFRNNSKIDTLVKFPLDGLDISDFVINKKNGEKFIYDLFAVSNHFGSMGFGHYTAYAKNYFTNKWYDFDDSHVTEKSESDIVNSSAYVLFYRRRNLRELVNLNEIYLKQYVNYEENLRQEVFDATDGNSTVEIASVTNERNVKHDMELS